MASRTRANEVRTYGDHWTRQRLLWLLVTHNLRRVSGDRSSERDQDSHFISIRTTMFLSIVASSVYQVQVLSVRRAVDVIINQIAPSDFYPRRYIDSP